MENDDQDIRLNTINFGNANWITNYEIKAYNDGHFTKRPFLPVAVQGVLKTKDDQILFGLRGGEITQETKEKIGRGLYGVLPAGWVTFSLEDDILTNAISREFMEEVGKFDLCWKSCRGIFEAYRPGPNNINFVFELVTDASFNQIHEIHSHANLLRDKLLKMKASKIQIKEELKERELPPDAWEHSVLLSIPNDKKSIETLVNSQPQSFTGIGAGALMTYASSLDYEQL